MDHSQHTLHTNDPSTHYMHTEKTLESTLITTVSPVQMNHDMHKMHGHMHDVQFESNNDNEAHTMVHHMMSMAFHFGYEETILFNWWKINTIGGLVASMLVIFIMASLYEGLKYYREYLFWKTYNLLEYRPVTAPQANAEAGRSDPSPQTSNSRVQYVGEVIHKQPPSMLSKNHFIQTFLHMVQVTLSFLLMLIFMTYNVWLCMAVALGAAFGYFLFCWKKSVIVDVTEHCH